MTLVRVTVTIVGAVTRDCLRFQCFGITLSVDNN